MLCLPDEIDIDDEYMNIYAEAYGAHFFLYLL